MFGRALSAMLGVLGILWACARMWRKRVPSRGVTWHYLPSAPPPPFGLRFFLCADVAGSAWRGWREYTRDADRFRQLEDARRRDRQPGRIEHSVTCATIRVPQGAPRRAIGPAGIAPRDSPARARASWRSPHRRKFDFGHARSPPARFDGFTTIATIGQCRRWRT